MLRSLLLALQHFGHKCSQQTANGISNNLTIKHIMCIGTLHFGCDSQRAREMGATSGIQLHGDYSGVHCRLSVASVVCVFCLVSLAAASAAHLLSAPRLVRPSLPVCQLSGYLTPFIGIKSLHLCSPYSLPTVSYTGVLALLCLIDFGVLWAATVGLDFVVSFLVMQLAIAMAN